jgi:hypothetical protein
MVDELIYDAWTPLSFKRALGPKRQPGFSWVAPTWVGEHARRLQAYKILQSYVDNAARHFLILDSDDDRAAHREYGDAALVSSTIQAALLGSEQTIVTAGADDYREELDDDADPEDVAANEEARGPWELQEWLRQWAIDERLAHKMIETERNAVQLGDGVYTLGWSGGKGRPRLRVFDPGFYFPVLDDGNEDEFPRTVHIAWEYEDDDGKTWIKRITWQLGPIRPVLSDGPVESLREWVPGEGDTVLEDGTLQRQYAWNDEPSQVTCYLTDARWEYDAGSPRELDELDPSKAVYSTDEDGEIRERDLRIDFIPVVHIPNTIAISNHFGTSSLARVAQILDDIANADTDLQASSATTGKPPIALGGASMGSQRLTYKPGEVLETGDGTLSVVDTSKSLDALLKYTDRLRDVLSTNARLPGSVLGRVSPADVPSGISLLLSFGPMSSMVDEMRLVRDEKNTLLLKFNWRIAVAAGMEGVPTEWYDSSISLGPYLPEDTAAEIHKAVELYKAKVISLETCVRMLMEAGLPIEDAVEEVRRIQERDFEGAVQLADALESPAPAADYLGKELPAAPAPIAPTIPLPPRPVPVPPPPDEDVV